MPPRIILKDFQLSVKPEKKVGEAKIVFLSRFVQKKNFNWLLDHIRGAGGELSIDIYGPIEDADYWDKCQEIIKTFPDNIRIEAKGPVPHEESANTLAKYHFFVLPTLGENFGHIFIEALAAGCPLIISDRSPWRNLEKEGIGWDIPLEEPETWLNVINSCLEMNNADYREMSQRARRFAVDWLSDSGHEKANKQVLEFAFDQNVK
jgi:glycosyltransferase involved in cell wall biosynthesis